MVNYLQVFVQTHGLQHIAKNIFLHLDLISLLNCKAVNKHWNELIQSFENDNLVKPIWLSAIQKIENGVLKNYYQKKEIIELFPKYRDVITHKNVQFMSLFPKWTEFHKYMKTKELKEIKIYVKHMIQFLTTDWKTFKVDFGYCCPILYAIHKENMEFLEFVFNGPFELNEEYLGEKLISWSFIEDRTEEHILDGVMEGADEMEIKINVMFKFAEWNNLPNVHKICIVYAHFKNLSLHCFEHPRNEMNLVHTWNLLHLACRSGFDHIVKMFCQDQFIEINVMDHKGDSALHDAFNHDMKEVVQILCNHSAIDLNIQDENGDTLINLACDDGRFDIVKLLCQKPQIDLNLRNNDGETPLHCACRNGNFEIVEFLSNHPSIDVNNQYTR